MRLLLDTHAFLWFVTDDPALSTNARQLIEEAENEVYLSIASIWEMAIKVSLGKLVLQSPFEQFIDEQLEPNQISVLPISVHQTSLVASLPFHHRDPFDRMLLAQSKSLEMPLISRDTEFDAYDVVRLW